MGASFVLSDHKEADTIRPTTVFLSIDLGLFNDYELEVQRSWEID